MKCSSWSRSARRIWVVACAGVGFIGGSVVAQGPVEASGDGFIQFAGREVPVLASTRAVRLQTVLPLVVPSAEAYASHAPAGTIRQVDTIREPLDASDSADVFIPDSAEIAFSRSANPFSSPPVSSLLDLFFTSGWGDPDQSTELDNGEEDVVPSEDWQASMVQGTLRPTKGLRHGMRF